MLSLFPLPGRGARERRYLVQHEGCGEVALVEFSAGAVSIDPREEGKRDTRSGIEEKGMKWMDERGKSKS